MMPSKAENDKPLVAVSPCLLGQKVRYDGADKRNGYIVQELGRRFDFLPLCPEVEIGLGVPREPVELVDHNGRVRALGRQHRQLDISGRLLAHAERMLPRLRACAGYIFKSRSPSCGLDSTPVYDEAGHLLRHDSGLFARAVRRALPELPCIEETGLKDPAARRRFLSRVDHYHSLLLRRHAALSVESPG